MKKLVEQARSILTNYVDKEHKGVRSRAAKALGIANVTLSQWLDGVRVPNLENLSPVFEQLGIDFSTPKTDAGKDVCFVNAKLVPAAEDTYEPPQAEDYLAAPMVGEVGAGPGYIPQEDIKSWFLVYRNLPAVRYRRNLLAVEIGPHSDSMQPTLNPRDIVLVDRDDRDIQHPGHMMLVLDPDGAGMIKRVAVEDLDNGDSRITFYSDNAMKHPPAVYSLERHYYNDWERCIVGRVIWAWADMREK
jgi:phage repressor protein C with HTH and peptisase S24 domain